MGGGTYPQGGQRSVRHLKGAGFGSKANTQGEEASYSGGHHAHPSQTIGHPSHRHGGKRTSIRGLSDESLHQTLHLFLGFGECFVIRRLISLKKVRTPRKGIP